MALRAYRRLSRAVRLKFANDTLLYPKVTAEIRAHFEHSRGMSDPEKIAQAISFATDMTFVVLHEIQQCAVTAPPTPAGAPIVRFPAAAIQAALSAPPADAPRAAGAGPSMPHVMGLQDVVSAHYRDHREMPVVPSGLPLAGGSSAMWADVVAAAPKRKVRARGAKGPPKCDEVDADAADIPAWLRPGADPMPQPAAAPPAPPPPPSAGTAAGGGGATASRGGGQT